MSRREGRIQTDRGGHRPGARRTGGPDHPPPALVPVTHPNQEKGQRKLAFPCLAAGNKRPQGWATGSCGSTVASVKPVRL